ncbi:MAG: polysaccharide biosynthesis tyrosine autokinase [Prevotellaceae bacterium]|jgi:capsular exopolysaccharide synthesis family protein|nr:polysaccharide biosynthesis tyrosine autokinase [Prevotellaceae bacterium]
MENIQNTQNTQNQQVQFSEEQSGFDLMKWVMLILKHWYLFVFFVLAAMSYTWWQNRKWVPQYRSEGTILIGGQTATRDQTFMRGFGLQQNYEKYDNQSYIIRSHDFIGRVVDSLPNFTVEYFSRGRFKTNNLYNASPVDISYSYIAPTAYGKYFKLTLNGDGTFVITPEEQSNEKKFALKGKSGEPIRYNLFVINVFINSDKKREIYFRFRDRASLVSELSGRLNVNMLTNASSIMSMSMSSATPARDVDFINKLCQVYIDNGLDKKNEVATRTINFIDEQMSNIQSSLSSSEDDLNRYRQENQIVSTSVMSTDVMGKMTAARASLDELVQRETYLNFLADYLSKNIQQDSISAPTSFGWSEPLLTASVDRINDLIIKRKSVKIDNPYYAQYTREIQVAKGGILEAIRSMRVALNIQKNTLQRQMSEAQQQLATLPIKEQTMRSFERQYKVDDSYYTYFLQKRAEASIQKASNSADDTILDRARQMNMTNGRERSRNTSTGLAIGLLIPLVLIIVKELFNNTIRNSDELEKLAYFPNIGSVRHSKRTDPVLAAKNPRSSFTEMFRVIRTRIEFILQRKENILILVTSSESGDGKTYFSTNLASVYAMTKKKTLMIDMDIRKPSILREFKETSKFGITDYLIGDCTLDEAITKVKGIDFDILPGGTIPPNPGELVRSEKLRELFDILRERYDFIIMDTSPVGLVADAYSLMTTVADINLFVVRQNKTNKIFTKRILMQLKADKISRIYSVLNDADIDRINYYGKYGKYGEYGAYGYGYYYFSKSRKREIEQRKKYYSDEGDI